jgi:hypothetical protein
LRLKRLNHKGFISSQIGASSHKKITSSYANTCETLKKNSRNNSKKEKRKEKRKRTIKKKYLKNNLKNNLKNPPTLLKAKKILMLLDQYH